MFFYSPSDTMINFSFQKTTDATITFSLKNPFFSKAKLREKKVTFYLVLHLKKWIFQRKSHLRKK